MGMIQIRAGSIAYRGLSPAFAAALALAACVDTAVDLGARQPGVSQARIAARPGVSPRGARVALTSLEGAPDAVTARYKQLFASAAEARDIATVAAESAQYRARGYLSAVPAQGATRLSYVWDIFDRQGRRAQRLTDEVIVTGGADPWSGADDRALLEMARRGAGDLAAFLSNTPEAIAAADVSSGGGKTLAAAAGEGLSVVAAQRSAPSPEPTRAAGFAQAR
jgi:hypothetical protein